MDSFRAWQVVRRKESEGVVKLHVLGSRITIDVY